MLSLIAITDSLFTWKQLLAFLINFKHGKAGTVSTHTVKFKEQNNNSLEYAPKYDYLYSTNINISEI